MKPNKILSLIIISMLVLGMFCVLTPRAYAAANMAIVNPVDGTNDFFFKTADKTVGDTFAVNLTVVGVIDLSTWQARVNWDPALLDYVSLRLPSDNVFSRIPPSASILPAGPDTSTPGSVLYGAAVNLPPGTTWGFNGSGTLAVLTLKIIQGVSQVGPAFVTCDIEYANLVVDTFLLNRVPNDILQTPINGVYMYPWTSTPPPPTKGTIAVSVTDQNGYALSALCTVGILGVTYYVGTTPFSWNGFKPATYTVAVQYLGNMQSKTATVTVGQTTPVSVTFNTTTRPQPMFSVGDWVRTMDRLRVREGPGLGEPELGVIPEGTLGQIVGGSVEADGYVWWEISYLVGVRGWSAENWLQLSEEHTEGPDFSITVDPTLLIIQPSSSASLTVTVVAIDGFDRLVFLKVSGAPQGVKTSLDLFVAPYPEGSAVAILRVSADETTEYGSYTLVVNGTSDAISHVAYVNLEITSQLFVSEVSQYRSDGTHVIGEGRTTPESTVVFKATIVNPQGGPVRFEIELRQMNELYIGEPTPETISDFVLSGSQVTITRPGLWNGDYHWQYRARDSEGVCSDWKEFGLYSGNIDFTVYVGSDPHISGLSTSSGAPGISIEIRGANFAPKDKTEVTFGLTPDDLVPKYADIVRVDLYEGEIIVLVPMGRGTVYVRMDVYVGFLEGERKSNTVSFTYQKPIVKAFSPDSGVPEEKVAIEGEHFGARAGKTDAATWVKFGRSFAEIVSWEDTRIVVKAPPDYGTGVDDFERTVALLSLGTESGVDFVIELIKQMFAIPGLDDLFIPEVGDVSDLGGVAIGVRVGTYVGISDSAFWTYEFDSSIIAGGSCPIEFRVYNLQGNISGLVNGEKKSEIPCSHSFGNAVVIFSANESYQYEVVGQDVGNYNLTVALITSDGNATFVAIDIPTSSNVTHQYTIDWTALSQDEEGVTIQVDSNGDGVFERSLTSDSELAQPEYFAAMFTGDIDGDKTVNMRDVIIAVNAFNSFPTHPRWNPYADLDTNGRIDMRDIMTIVLNFNRHYP